MNNKQKGNIGESLAVEYLEKLNYKILERNLYCSNKAEIDIIALDKSTYVFIEVKMRSNNSYGTALEAINTRKIKKIQLGIYEYFNNKNFSKIPDYRIDVIAITGSKQHTFEHLKNIGF